MNRFFDELKEARDQAAGKSRFNPDKNLRLTYVREEPKGWPLTRPATPAEWAHVLKVMIMRRVPRHEPIHRTKLIQYVSGDLVSASSAGRLYMGPESWGMRSVHLVLDRQMIGKDKILRTAPTMDDPEMAWSAPAIYRTEHADGWLGRVPVTVNALVDFLPVTNVLDLIVQALLDDE